MNMRRNTLLLLFAAMLVLSGCDFFRVIAGRPTSKDIDRKRVEIMKAEEAALQARLDSIARAEADARKAVEDSLAAAAFIAENKIIFHNVSRLGGLAKDGLEDTSDGVRYRVILGSFRDRNNAETLIRKVADAGDFSPHMLTLRSGMIAVAACPSDRLQNAVLGLKELKTTPTCPPDAWILKIE